MNKTANQSFLFSIISYLSFALGAIAQLFLYSRDFELYGRFQLSYSYADFLLSFVLLGLPHALVRFYPIFKEKKASHSFIFTSLGISFLLILFIAFISFIAADFWQNHGLKSWIKYAPYSLSILIAISINFMITKQLANLQNVSIAAVYNNFFPKIAAIIAFICFKFWSYTLTQTMWIYVSILILSAVGMFYHYSKLESQKKWVAYTVIEKDTWKNILNYAYYAILGSLSSYIAIRIDSIMIGNFISEKALGIYTTLLFINTAINIPTNGVYAMTTPQFSQMMNNQDTQNINKLFKQTTLYLFFTAALILSFILTTANTLFGLMHNGELLQQNLNILLILGIATLIDVATGFNSIIISLSNYYKYNMYFILMTALVTILNNYVLLKVFNLGLSGVAFANLGSIIFFNGLKTIFIYKKFKLHPFSTKQLYILITLILTLLITYFMPNLGIFNLLYKPLICLSLFLLLNSLGHIIPINTLLHRTKYYQWLRTKILK